jgi:hypothetical protein
MRSDKRLTHPLNVTYLVVGLVFLGISGSWALRTAGLVDNRGIGWLIPLLLVAAGAVGLLASTAKGLRRTRTTDDADPDDLDDGSGYAGDTFDPGLTSFAVDDLDEKLERAARASGKPIDGPTEVPTDKPTDSPNEHQGETR